MILNYIWLAFFLISFTIAFVQWLLTGDAQIFKTIVDGIFKSAGDSVDLSFKLIGIMTLFLGFMNIGEKAGAIRFLSRIVGPFFGRLFPEVPAKHPAMGHMMMNFSANLLGLDNAATPFGLKAMQSLQELNPNKAESRRRIREARLRVALAKLKSQRMEQKYYERYGEKPDDSEESSDLSSDSEEFLEDS